MGKISNYARVLVAKLQDVFVVDQTDNNVTTTKSVTVEQIGDTIAGTQVHSDLKTDNQTIIGGINELAKDKNVADEYDDTHTYNAGDVTIYGNTLYICNTNNTTGDFDPSKWTATTIDNVIGSLSSLTTTDKSSLVGAVNEVNGKVNCALISQNRLTSDYTLTSNTATRVFDDGTANLSAGNYIFEVTFPAIWTSAAGVIHGGIRVDNTYTEASIIYGPQEVCGMITFKGTVNIPSSGTHTIGSAIRTEAGKTVTIKSYVSATVTLWRC